jgi:oxygen-independent coproporphyrinogen-3 oxidase
LSHNTAIPILRQQPSLTAGAPLWAARGQGSAGSTAHGPVRSLYIHVPFCFHKCHYCDFYSIVDTRDRQGPFVDRLIRELAALSPWAQAAPLKTIFVGGGTPSLLRSELWKTLLDALERLYDLSVIRTAKSVEGGPAGEFTVECNPETVSPELMDILVSGGVNRVSIGAQSFNPVHLKTLERWHDPENVGRAVEMAKAAGIGRQSVDLIFGVPGQSLADWVEDLERALSLGTEHISCYNLTYEPKTAMTARLALGEFQKADEDLEVQMFAATLSRLRRAGLQRYEVSNFARRGGGTEAQHNLAYWRQEQWLAAGPAASAHVGGHRWKNAPRLDDYLAIADVHGFAPITDHEPPDAARALTEKIMTGLRLAEGLCADSILAQAAALEPGAEVRLRTEVARHQSQGLMSESAGRWVLTDAGFMLADGITVDLLAALDRPAPPTTRRSAG